MCWHKGSEKNTQPLGKMGGALGHARCTCARSCLMLQKGFVSRNPTNHAVTVPVPAASAGRGVGPWNDQSHWCPSTSSEGAGKRKQVGTKHL